MIVGQETPFVVGITSFGNCSDSLPDVYTRVSVLIDWIEKFGRDESDVEQGSCSFVSEPTPPIEVEFYSWNKCDKT